jgi:glutamate 5-kinase
VGSEIDKTPTFYKRSELKVVVGNMKNKHSRTIVIKLGMDICWGLIIGTSSICDEHTHEPLLSNLSLMVETSVRLRREGHRVIIVSSGAIGIGLRRMDIAKKPKRMATVQVSPFAVV